MRLGDAVHQSGEAIAVACTSTGARGVPPVEQLQAIPGKEVVIFYDRFDEHDEGQKGAKKMAKALQDIGKKATVAEVPHAGEVKKGWDISDAFNAGFDLKDIQQAETEAKHQDIWASEVAGVVTGVMNYSKTAHLEGSKNTAHWDKSDRRLTVHDNSTEKKILDVVWEQEKWKNVDSHLSKSDVDYFLKEVQPILLEKTKAGLER
ncbi:hypothetical protein [Okeania sp. KiyG1]|uniref:hypothetical protein n=1 Tax=Okeania sp. KiyG1 TaxID=2720165 RepID=UPI001923DF68|nr:hypothetical protein [Okeania sp. KiyG1]GGA02368.1 hypothetical protein CYANOKiyG1_14410 [Okeania sp. KiyG1]